MQDTSVKRLKRNQALEGVRGLAAIGVVAAHLLTTWPGAPEAINEFGHFGANGLILFFVLSGYLLFLPMLEKQPNVSPNIKVGRFFLNRVIRIFPLYLSIFLICESLSITHVKINNDGSYVLGTITDAKTLLANLTLTQTLFPGTALTGIAPSWSLTVEFGFYLLLAILALVLHRVGSKRTSLIVIIALSVISLSILGSEKWIVGNSALAGTPATQWGNSLATIIMRSFPAQGFYFALGMLAAWFVINRPQQKTFGVLKLPVLIFSITILTVVSVFYLHNDFKVKFIFAFLSAALVFALANSSNEKSIFQKAIVAFKPLGTISFGIYLVHLPLIALFRKFNLLGYESQNYFQAIDFVLFIVALLVVSWILHLAIEKPTMKLMKRWY